MKPKLEFDPVAHRYTFDGRRVISNTDLLEAEGFSDYSGMPEDRRIVALAIGTDVHEATKRYDLGQKLHGYEHVGGYLDGWKQFRRDFKFVPKLREQPLHDPAYNLATTPDAWGPSIHGGEITVQIKTGAIKDWTGLQLAFEERCIWLYLKSKPNHILAAATMRSSTKRFAVELRPDGTYKPQRFECESDIAVFLAASQVFMWKLNHGIHKL